MRIEPNVLTTKRKQGEISNVHPVGNVAKQKYNEVKKRLKVNAKTLNKSEKEREKREF